MPCHRCSVTKLDFAESYERRFAAIKLLLLLSQKTDNGSAIRVA